MPNTLKSLDFNLFRSNQNDNQTATEALKEALSNNSLVNVPFAHQQLGKVYLEKGKETWQ